MHDQNLYLPSLNEMKNLVLGKSNKKLQPEQSNDTSSHIYFWWLEDVKIKIVIIKSFFFY